ncbi:DEAD/DEAH box helicase [Angustibacter speluncae]
MATELDRFPELERFAQLLGFDLDPFQVEACEALEQGHGVLVAAPTGAGKTVVGEFAVHLALARGGKAFYTTPIKALSNQKYADLVARHGAASVGLLTGDTSLNGDAPVVVMTTEVLRNMLYAGSPTLGGLAFVVMDEVHYLADRFRGPVWEEVILHLPEHVQLASLSATVSNAEEFGAWLDTVRGDTRVVVSEHRPVPLWQHVVVGSSGAPGERAGVSLLDLFVEDEDGRQAVNPDVRRLQREVVPFRGRDRRHGGRPRGRAGGRDGGGRSEGGSFRHHRGFRGPSRAQVVERLDAQGLLPAITFIFSRAGCDAAVRQCLASGVRLTTREERAEIRAVVERKVAQIADRDLATLGYHEWVEGLQRGLAAHHAGMLPTFKEVVEELFTRGLVKAVFATETLALGINMPARTVVLEKLVKFNGEAHVPVTAGEYTQLTGRAGRRGIDIEGHAVVVWDSALDPEQVAGLASARTYPLRSSFRPTYNMAVNLVAQVGREAAREILETSFAQFQADRGVVGLARQVREQDEALEGYRASMTCHLGDFSEYMALRRRVGELEKETSREASKAQRGRALESLERLRIGDVILVPSGRRSGYAVVLDPGTAGGLDGPRPSVLTLDRQVRRLALHDVPDEVRPVTTLKVPRNFNARNPAARRDLASSLRNVLAEGRLADNPPRERRRREVPEDAAAEVARVRAQLKAHPCHRCPEREDHARWAERYHRLRKERSAVARRIDGRTSTIARTFDRVCDLLLDLGYLRRADEVRGGVGLTTAGERLRRVYTEKDLLVAECLRAGAWRGLDGPGMAAVASAVVYEARREQVGAAPAVPGGATRAALDATTKVWSDLQDTEARHRVDLTGAPDLGMTVPLHRWARGQHLEQVLEDGDLTPGDFVRWTRQAIDLLAQIALACEAADAPPEDAEVAAAARAALAAVDRGVMAWSSVR